MIRCLIVQISRNQRGQPIRKELLVTGETIQIGRAAGCKILLLDHRVSLHHAAIRHSDEGRLYIECEVGANILINGSFGSRTEITPGTHIAIGPYELLVETPAKNYDLIISIEMVQHALDDHEQHSRQASVTLAEAGLSKRKPALLLVGLIALVCLWFPLMPTLSSILPKWMSNLHLSFNDPWQLGSMTRGHHLVNIKCASCHQKPFLEVPDKACESCHKSVAKHVTDKTLHVNVFKDIRCVECHHDHRGEAGPVIHDGLCVTCHAKIKEKNENTKLTNVTNFATNHPPFSLTFMTGPKSSDVLRLPQNDKTKLVEKSGLKFSHKVHLDKKGVSSPEGDTVLECRDCHQLDQAGTRFKPISMEKNCQQSGCHALRFKPPVAGRQIAHGSERKVMIALREHHAAAVFNSMAAGEKPYCAEAFSSTKKSPFERALECANGNASVNAKSLFRPDKSCGECHEVTPTDDKDVPWKVTPVTITGHWLRNSRFSHAKHATAKCTECHDKSTSEKSADVSIPEIEKCRECHTGEKQITNKISSRCSDCHGFHNANLQPSAAATK